ncbi:hypothetical protein SPARM206S_05116 [Streptomyces parvulus]
MADTNDTEVEYEDDGTGDYTITFSMTLPAPADDTEEK